MPERVRISVIIASYNSKRTITECLRSLESPSHEKGVEIIVVDSSTDGTAKFVHESFPKVKLIRFRERKYCGDARNVGIKMAKGDIIAFIDADCVADTNWLDEIIKAHRSPHLAIGGAVLNGTPESLIAWAAFFCEFSQWMPATRKKYMKDIAGANISYKKEVFYKLGMFIEGTYCSDTNFHWRLEKGGHRLLFEPSMLVYHRYLENWKRYLIHEYDHGLSFARVRVESKNFTRTKRFIFGFCFPLIALKVFLKMAIVNLKHRNHLIFFMKALPLSAAGVFFWSVGECVGYLKGQRNG
jgi:GT2 family glycosyltransferase